MKTKVKKSKNRMLRLVKILTVNHNQDVVYHTEKKLNQLNKFVKI